MVDETWQNLRQILDKWIHGSFYMEAVKAFGSSLNRLMEQGILVHDIDGALLTGRSGKEFLGWSRDPKPPSY